MSRWLTMFALLAAGHGPLATTLHAQTSVPRGVPVPRAGGGGALLADYGELATGASNTNRPVRLPKHFTTTQPQPASMAVTASGCGRATNVVTCTLTGVPASPGLAVGGQVAVAGMANANFNGTFVITALPSSTQVRWTDADADATTDGGTLSSALWPKPSVGGSFTDPTFGSPIRLLFDDGTADASPCVASYPTWPTMNITQEYVTCDDGGEGIGIIRLSDNAEIHKGTIGSISNQPRWSPSESTPYSVFYASGAAIRRIINVTSGPTTEQVKTFSATYTSATWKGGKLMLSPSGDVLAAMVGCNTGSCPNDGSMDTFVYNLTLDAVTGTYNTPSVECNIDDLNVYPDGSYVINYACSGTGQYQGIAYINANGTFNRHVWDNNMHHDITVVDGRNVLIGPNNSNSPETGCPDDDPGAGVRKRGNFSVDVVTGEVNCLYAKALNNAAGTDTAGFHGGYVNCSGYWCALTMNHDAVEVVELNLPASWDATWGRGSGEVWVCRAWATIDGTNNCYRPAHLRRRPQNTSGGAAVYWRTLGGSLSMLRGSDNAGSIPHYLISNTDFGQATDTSDATGGRYSMPVRITLREP